MLGEKRGLFGALQLNAMAPQRHTYCAIGTDVDNKGIAVCV
jgi:hypothetical protein